MKKQTLCKKAFLLFAFIPIMMQAQNNNQPVSTIYQTQGEKKFRALESAAIQALDVTKTIISTGGGALLDDANAKHLKILGKLPEIVLL